jgi:hypothetical protein
MHPTRARRRSVLDMSRRRYRGTRGTSSRRVFARANRRRVLDERDARRRRSHHHRTHRATSVENARTRERNVSLDGHPFELRLGTIGGGVWGGKSRFCGKYLAGDLSVLSMGVRVFTHMGDSMESVWRWDWLFLTFLCDFCARELWVCD